LELMDNPDLEEVSVDRRTIEVIEIVEGQIENEEIENEGEVEDESGLGPDEDEDEQRDESCLTTRSEGEEDGNETESDSYGLERLSKLFEPGGEALSDTDDIEESSGSLEGLSLLFEKSGSGNISEDFNKTRTNEATGTNEATRTNEAIRTKEYPPIPTKVRKMAKRWLNLKDPVEKDLFDKALVIMNQAGIRRTIWTEHLPG